MPTRDPQPVVHRGRQVLTQEFAPRHDLFRHIARLEPPEHRRLQPAEAEIERVALHLGEREPHRVGIPMRRKHINHRPARIPKTQELRDFIERLPGRIVTGFPQQPVTEPFGDFKQVRVPAAYHQRQRRKFDGALTRYRVNVSLDVVHRDQRQLVDHRQRLAVGHTDQQRSH